MQLQRREIPILIVNAIYIPVFTVLALLRHNFEFLLYAGVVLLLATWVLLTQSRVRFTPTVLWGLTLWGLLHMAGGNIRVGDGVLYSVQLVPVVLRYDQLVHAFGFGVATLVCYHLLRPHLRTDVPRRGSVPVLVVLMGCGVGAINEIVEFVAVLIMPETGVGGYENTMWDLVFNLIGAVLAVALVSRRAGSAGGGGSPGSAGHGVASVVAGLLLATTAAPTSAEDVPASASVGVETKEERPDAWGTQDVALAALNAGIAHLERYEFADAVQQFERAVQLAPRLSEARFDLALALFNRAGRNDLEQAEQALDSLLADEPDHVHALYLRGAIYQYSGRDEAAVACFERVLARRPGDAATWYLLARSQAHLNQPSRPALERAIQENPFLASAYYDLLRLSAQEDKAEDVERYQRQFTQLRESPLCEMVNVPHYRQMGPLAIVRPLPAAPQQPTASGEVSGGVPRTLLTGVGGTAAEPGAASGEGVFSCLALADVNGDGRLDIVATRREPAAVVLLLGQEDHTFADATAASGLRVARPPLACSFGDYDNDRHVDLFVCCAGPNHLFRNRGDGTFEDVTASMNTAGADVASTAMIFLDADHDGDLDIYVCNTLAPGTGGSTTTANQLLNNNGDGAFTDIAATAGVACADTASIGAAFADVDSDRDLDLVVFNLDAPARLFLNDRGGRYHEGIFAGELVRAPGGGVHQDFNGDGRVDLLVLPAVDTRGGLYLMDDLGILRRSPQFDSCLRGLLTWGDPREMRVGDVDLDGDLDVVVLGAGNHLLLNDGTGRFSMRPNVWPLFCTGRYRATQLVDVSNDGVPELLGIGPGDSGTLALVPTRLQPPARWLGVTPTGMHGDDRRMRSPASGYGTGLELRCGRHRQVVAYTGLHGSAGQSCTPVVFGLNGAARVDYVALTWPDGVTQCEDDLALDRHHRIAEVERRVSSCPVLFAWDGTHFAFVGDFAGVGGLGYFVAPAQYAAPQPRELVRIDARDLRPRDGYYELRVCEPMEEVAYIDQLVLTVIDHSADVTVYPDERLTISGPPPSQRLLATTHPVFPLRAIAHNGTDCAARLRTVDRVYAYDPPRDPRFLGFCEPHTLTLEFPDAGDTSAAGRPLYLLIAGSIEYPYSQTTYAAAQAGVAWQPLKVERLDADGHWMSLVEDAGAPPGMGRTIAVELTGLLPAGPATLRLTTNLEVYFDQVFLAADAGEEALHVVTLPPAAAELRRLGFPREWSPDGRFPTVYTYDIIEQVSSFKIPRGSYTRYGRVDELLLAADDHYVIMGTGDELAVRFSAAGLPPPPPRHARGFILESTAYCKDMDLYTGTPDTVEPLPCRGMSSYPDGVEQGCPADGDTLRYRERFNTRNVK
ncbi:MAG TPA: DUF2238 domain-containing protein [Phycisphaerae bacterium]|nr:DUF2238 domain-containing protein [Phycisphaerae bacterium]HNU44520.1 DUF2238 domain-containing protein [Phycisphaerae bacterium]